MFPNRFYFVYFYLKGCDYVIALTHMRTRNDKKLAENTTDIDLILGGHDHVYDVIKVRHFQWLSRLFK